MPENEEVSVDAAPVEEQQTVQVNAFDESSWSEEQPAKVEVKEDVKPEVKIEAEVKPEVKVEEKVEQVKPEVNKSEVKEEVIEITPETIEKFRNETYEILAQKKEIEKANSYDVTKVSEAKKLLELNLKLQNKNLDADEIKEEIEDKYSYPKQPKQKVDEEQNEYDERLDEWKEKVAKIDKRMTRDAKNAKAELTGIADKLILPELPKTQIAKKEQTQEELAQFEKMRSEYLKSADEGVTSLNDFTFTAADKEVPVKVTYKVEEAEKAALKERFTDFDTDQFLQSRWLTKDGKFNGAQQARDVYVLENFEKIVQKAVNEAVSTTKLHKEKTVKNITLNGENPEKVVIADKSLSQLQHEAIWDA